MANKPGRIDDDPVPEQSTVNEPKNSEDTSKMVIPDTGIEQKSPDTDEVKDDHVFIRPDDLHLKSDEVHEPKPNDLAKLFAGAITGLLRYRIIIDPPRFICHPVLLMAPIRQDTASDQSGYAISWQAKVLSGSDWIAMR